MHPDILCRDVCGPRAYNPSMPRQRYPYGLNPLRFITASTCRRARLLVSPTLDSSFGEVTLGAGTTGSDTCYALSESSQNASRYFSGHAF